MFKKKGEDSDSAGFTFKLPRFGSGFGFEMPGFAHHWFVSMNLVKTPSLQKWLILHAAGL